LEDLFIQQRSSSEEKSIRPPRQGWNVYSQSSHIAKLRNDKNRLRDASNGINNLEPTFRGGELCY
jgi:hypothetical protein